MVLTVILLVSELLAAKCLMEVPTPFDWNPFYHGSSSFTGDQRDPLCGRNFEYIPKTR